MKSNPCIYYLKATNENSPRYVGQTTWPTKRLQQHKIRALKKEPKDRTHKDNWIVKTISQGYDIELVIIEYCSISELDEKELYWYLYYSRELQLTNTSTPGKTNVLQMLSSYPKTRGPMKEETKQKIRETKLGDKNPQYGKKFIAPDGYGDSISQALKHSQRFQESRKSLVFREKISKIQSRSICILDENKDILFKFQNCKEAAEYFGMTRANIATACRNHRVIKKNLEGHHYYVVYEDSLGDFYGKV